MMIRIFIIISLLLLPLSVALESNVTNFEKTIIHNNSIETAKNTSKISSIENRFSEIGIVGIIVSLLLVLISFRSVREAKLEAQQTIQDFLDKEVEEFINNELNKKADKFLSSLKEDSENKVNSLIQNLDDLNNDVYVSFNDIEYLKLQTNLINKKPLLDRTFNDYKIKILYDISQKNYNLAIEKINNLIKHHYGEKKALLLYIHGIICDKNREIETSIEKLNEAIKEYSEFVSPYIKLANIYTTVRFDENKAFFYVQKTLKYDPNNYEIYNILGFLYEKKKNYSEAIKNYQKSRKINPDYPHSYNNLGTIYTTEGDYEKAYNILNEGITTTPTYLYTHLGFLRLNLIEDKPFNKEIENKLKTLLKKQNNFDVNSIYFMLKLFQKSYTDLNIDNEINKWKKYNQNYIHRDYSFGIIENWINNQKDIKLKNKQTHILNNIKEYFIY